VYICKEYEIQMWAGIGRYVNRQGMAGHDMSNKDSFTALLHERTNKLHHTVNTSRLYLNLQHSCTDTHTDDNTYSCTYSSLRA
jgi:hypothetical protein